MSDNVQTYKPKQPAESTSESPQVIDDGSAASVGDKAEEPKEIGGRKGPNPTRYGDWEKNGRCIDF